MTLSGFQTVAAIGELYVNFTNSGSRREERHFIKKNISEG